MTQPSTTPPDVVGTNPRNASEVNISTGTHLRQFLGVRVIINEDQSFFAATDLKVAPYYFTAAQETEIKTAVSELNIALQAIDTTFISRVAGMAP